MSEQVNCVEYARYSCIHNSPLSIEDQFRVNDQFAKERGWNVVGRFYDKEQSGQRIAPREGFKAMLREAMKLKPPFTKIIVDSTSRIARNTRDALDVFSLLTYCGVHVYYVSQNIDTSQDGAEDLITLHGIVDSQFIRNLRHQTRRGIAGKVLKHLSAGGRRYGYRSRPVYSGKVDIYGNEVPDGYELEIYILEAETVRRICWMYGEEDYSARKIVRILNEELKRTGQPKPPRGKWWSIWTLLGSRRMGRGILNNELYIGKYYWNRNTYVTNPLNSKRKIVENKKEKWLMIPLPNLRIIDHNLWEKVKQRQKQVSENSQGKFARCKGAYSSKLLTSLIKCPTCSGNIVVVSGGKYPKYGCSNHWNRGSAVCINDVLIPCNELETRMVEALGMTFNESDLGYVTEKVNSLLDMHFADEGIAWDEKELARDLQRAEKELKNLTNAIASGLTADVVREKLLDVESEKKAIEKRLAAIEDRKKKVMRSVSKDDVKQYLENLLLTLRIHPAKGRAFLAKALEIVDVNAVLAGCLKEVGTESGRLEAVV